jgi:hypothetical protein
MEGMNIFIAVVCRILKCIELSGKCRVILLENTRSDNAMIATFQDVTEPLVAPLSKDCRWNTDVEKLAMAAGLSSVSDVEKIDFGTLMLGVYKK